MRNESGVHVPVRRLDPIAVHLPQAASSRRELRILYISYETGLAGPLLHAQILPHIEVLNQSGFRFYVLVFEDAMKSAEEIRHFDEIRSELEDSGSTIWALKRSRLWGPFRISWDALRMGLLATWICLRYRIPIIHARSLLPGILGRLLGSVIRRRWVFDPRLLHARARALAGRHSWNGRRFRRIRALERSLAADANAVRVESQEHYRAYTKRVRGRKMRDCHYWIAPNSVDLRRFKPDPDTRRAVRARLGLEENLVLVYSGIFSLGRPNRQILDFFKACRELSPGAHLLILTYSGLDGVQALIQQAGVFESCTVLSTFWKEVPSYLCAADAGLALNDPVAYGHSVPLKFGEYLACGLPVIVNAGLANTGDITERNRVGVVLEDLSPRSMERGARQLRELLQERDRLRQRCRKAAEEELSLTDSVKQLSEMYRGLVSDSAAS